MLFSNNIRDHAEWGEEQTEEAEKKISEQKLKPVATFDKSLYMTKPATYWDRFYRNNKDNFFKDRAWLQLEFPVLWDAMKEDSGPRKILEVGCGAGNTVFPIVRNNKNPDLQVIGVDFSPRAVEIVRTSEDFDPKICKAEVWDLGNAEGELPDGVEEHSIDVVVMIFVFSALSPDQWDNAVRNVKKLLKPDGQMLFRDYGRYDLTQLRFKGGRLLDDNFYIRGDGTRVYFFTEEELETIFGKALEPVKIATDRRLIVNRKRKLKMFRIWLQASFRNRQ